MIPVHDMRDGNAGCKECTKTCWKLAPFWDLAIYAIELFLRNHLVGRIDSDRAINSCPLSNLRKEMFRQTFVRELSEIAGTGRAGPINAFFSLPGARSVDCNPSFFAVFSIHC